VITGEDPSFSGWWFQPNPFEKYDLQIGFIFPIFGVKIKNISNHQLVLKLDVEV